MVLVIGCRGASQAGNTSHALAQLEQLKLRRLLQEEEERRLEEQYVRMQQCLKSIAQDSTDEQYPLRVEWSGVEWSGVKGGS